MREELLHVMQQMEANVVAQVSTTVAGMVEEKSAALVSLKNEMAERKRLHNQVLDLMPHLRVFCRVHTHAHTQIHTHTHTHTQVLDLKGNIRVFCRARPPSHANKVALTFASDTEMVCEVSGKSHPFSYDCVFSPSSKQAAVFAETQPLVVSVLDGINILYVYIRMFVHVCVYDILVHIHMYRLQRLHHRLRADGLGQDTHDAGLQRRSRR